MRFLDALVFHLPNDSRLRPIALLDRYNDAQILHDHGFGSLLWQPALIQAVERSSPRIHR